MHSHCFEPLFRESAARRPRLQTLTRGERPFFQTSALYMSIPSSVGALSSKQSVNHAAQRPSDPP
jgi:hypothetical protein